MRFTRLKGAFSQHWQVPLAGVLGGSLAHLAHWPLPWMLGSLLAVIALRCLGQSQAKALPASGRRLGLCLVGSGIGLHFTREVWQQVLSHSLLILLGACCTLLLALLGVLLLRRAGVDRATAFFASLPGGSSEMVMMGLRFGADPARVAAAHSLRLLLVVLLVPSLFAWYLPKSGIHLPTEAASAMQLALLLAAGAAVALLWSRLRQPNPWMLGPLCSSAAISLGLDWQLSLPLGFGELGQWLIGCSLGCYFDRSFFRSAPRFLGAVLLSTLLGMLGILPLAWLLATFAKVGSFSLMLGMMPGGIAELTLTAEALQLSVALVAALQVLRLFLLVFLASPIYRLWRRLAGRAG